MNSALLVEIFGKDQSWHGPCTVITEGNAAVATQGTDSLMGGGIKQYAPRVISGRIMADAVCLLPENPPDGPQDLLRSTLGRVDSQKWAKGLSHEIP